MSRRSIGRRLERLEGQEGRVGTGGQTINLEFYDEAPDGTLIRLSMPNWDKGHVEGARTMRVVFRQPKHDGGGRGPGES
ncbi:MAG TPA: hypothetical protein VIY49_07225 [Bryobacteraceae bacterium]